MSLSDLSEFRCTRVETRPGRGEGGRHYGGDGAVVEWICVASSPASRDVPPILSNVC